MMKTRTKTKVVSLLMIGLTLLGITTKTTAQTTVIIGAYNVANGTQSYPCPIQDYYGSSRSQFLYTAAELSAAGLVNGSVINQLGFVVNATTISGHNIENYTMSLKNTAITTLSVSAWETGLTQVWAPFAYAYPSGYSGNVVFSTSNFTYTGGALVLETCGGLSSGSISLNPGVQGTSGFTQVVAHQYVVTGQTGCGGAATANIAITSYRPRLFMRYITSCTGTPAPGTTLSTNYNVCTSSTSFTLSLSNAFTGISGLTYQWQSSTLASGPYSNISGATSSTLTTTEASSLYYRCAVLCSGSGATGFSSGSLVTLLPTPVMMSSSTASICSGGTVSVFLSSNVSCNYSWYAADNPNTFGEQLSTLSTYTLTSTITNYVTTPEIVYFYVTPTSTTGGCVGTTQTLAVTVNPNVTPTLYISSSANPSCDGALPTFTANVTDGGAGVTYSWQTNYVNNGGTGMTYTPTSVANGNTYCCQISTYNTCQTTGGAYACMTQSVGTSPVMTSATSASTCSSNSINIPFTSNIAATYDYSAVQNSSVYGEPYYTVYGYTGIYDWLQNTSDTSQVIKYSVMSYDSAVGCPGTPQTVLVTVYPAPNVSGVTATPSSVCSGGSSVLSTTTTTQYTGGYCSAGATTIGCSTGDEYISNVSLNTINNSSTCPASGQYQDFSSISSSLTAGSSYPITVNCPNYFGGDQFAAWIDWNQDGDFADTGEQFNLTSAPVSTGTIVVPVTARNGGTMMRVRVMWTGTLSPCGTNNYGEVEDYRITVTGGANQYDYDWSPVALLSSSSAATPTASGITSSDTYSVTVNNGAGCGGSGSAYIFVNTLPIVSSVSASPATICNGSNSTLTATASMPSNTYCQPSTDCFVNGDYISSVSLASINHSTNTCDEVTSTGYSWLPSYNPTLVAGTGYSFSSVLNTTLDDIAVWIDYDQNGVFDNSTELIFSDGHSAATYTTTVTVPTTALDGATVMRVRSYYHYYYDLIDACASYWNIGDGGSNNGETEDYLVTISGATPPINYVWSPATNLSSTTGSTVTATGMTSTTTYTLTTTAALTGCTPASASTVTVTVNPVPAMSSASSATICSGGTVSIPLTSSVSGTTYTWVATSQPNITGESITTQNTSTLSNTLINTTTSAQTVIYTVTPTSSGGCIGASQTVTITVNPTPTVTSAATSTICSGTTVNLSFTSTVPSAYTWIAVDNTNTTGESLTSQTGGILNNTITNNSTVNQTVSYTVTPTSSPGGCAGSNQTVVVTVNPAPTMSSASSAIICSGGVVNIPLTSIVSSSYTWQAASNANITGESTGLQTSSTLNNTLINNTTSVQSVIYTVTPTAVTGSCAGTAQTVTVTVNPTPSMTSGTTATTCSGIAFSIPLTSNVASSYSWTAIDNANTTGESLTSQNANPMTNTITNNVSSVQTIVYNVTPTSTTGSCAGNAQTVTITVNPSPSMSSSATATICSGTLVSIPLTSVVASSYTWIAVDNTNTTGESLTTQSTSTLSNTITNNTAVAQTVSYTVTPTSSGGGCVGSNQTVVVTVNPAPTMSNINTATICSGGTVSIPLTSSVASSYTWIATNNANTTGESTTTQSATTLSNTIVNNTTAVQTVTYTVTPTATTGGCVGATQVITVTVNPVPAMTSASAATICSGGTVTIPFTSNVASAYSWIATDNANTTGESLTAQGGGALSNTITNNTSSVQTVVYTVTPTSSVGSCAGSSQTVNVTVNPSPSMTSANTGTICSGGTISIPLTSTVASSYTWIATNNANTTGESTTSQSTTTLSNTIVNNTAVVQTVTYTVTPTSSAGGCVGTGQTITVTVNPGPSMTSANTATICSGGTVSITLASTVASSYTWIATNNANTTGESTTLQSTATLSNTIVNNTTSVQTVTYTVTPTATTGSCVGAGQTVTVTVNPLPTMSSATTATICSGGTVSIPLTSIVASAYSWIATDNANTTGESLTAQATSTLSNTITNNTSTPQTVVYSVTPTSTVGSCVGTTQTVSVTVNPLPAMSSASSATICSGNVVNIPLTSTVASTYTWIATDNANTTGESTTSQSTATLNNTLTNNTAVAQTVSYTVTPTATTGGCVGASQTVSVTVNPSPTMTNATTATICSGGTVTIPLTSNVASGYTWIATDNTNTSGESTTLQSSSTLTNTIVNNSASVQTVSYNVTPTSTVGGCAGTVQTIVVTINPIPTMTNGTTAVICSGGTTNLSLTSNVGASYSWLATDNTNTTGESLTAQSGGVLSNTITNATASAQSVIYTVTPTSSVGSCVGVSQTVTVTVNPLPSVTSASTSTICSGGTFSIPLTSTVASTYSWLATNNPNTTGESTTSQTASTISNTLTNTSAVVQTVTYTVTPTSSAGGCVGSTQVVSITVNPAPAMTSPNAITICSGGVVSIPLTSTVASSYTWFATSNGNVTGESTSLQSTSTLSNTLFNSVAGTQTVIYTVTPTSSVGGCGGTAQTVTVTVNSNPNMTSASSVAVCSGVALAIGLTSDIASNYSWIATNNTNTTGESLTAQSTATINNTISNPTASAQTVIYSVTPTSIAGGCVGNAQTVTVTVNPIPTVTANASATTVCAGTAVTLTGGGASTYTWDNSVLDGVSFIPASTTTYNVTGTSGAGCTSTSSVTVTVNPIPSVGASATATAVCPGGSTTLTGSGASSYSWTGGVFDGVSFIPASTTTYTVTGTSLGCSATATITITVNAILPVTASATATAVCTGASTILTGGGAATYTWTGGVTDGVPYFPTSTGTYTVTGTSGACSNTATITITVNSNPTVVANASSTTVCSGASVTFTGGGASTYVWDNGVTNGVPAVVNSTTTYNVTGTTGAGCSGTASVTVNVNATPIMTSANTATICSGSLVSIPLTADMPSSFVWNAVNNPNTIGESTGLQFTSTLSNTIFNTSAIGQNVVYTVTPTATTGGCTGASQIVTVTVDAPPDMTSSATSTICSGVALNIPLTASVACNFTWVANNNVNTIGENTSTQYSSTINDGIINNTTSVQTVIYTVTPTSISGGCVGNSQTVVVTVVPLPVVTASSTANPVCTGSAVTLTGGGASTYIWNNGVTDGVSFIPPYTTNYIVTGTASTGCSNSASITINVNPLPSVTASSTSSAICIGGSVTLTGGGANTYSWSGSVANGVAFNPTSTQTYTVTGTNTTTGCVNTTTIPVTVNSLPTVTANVSSNNVCTGTSVIFTGGGASTYSWTGGVTDGAGFVPSSTSSYTVTGTDGNGCVNTASTTVLVNALITSSQTNAVCYGGSISVGSNTYNATGTYVDTLTAVGGCDSIVTSNLTINALITSSQSFAICTGSSVNVGIHTYNASGVYTDTLNSFASCDSVVTTTLSVNSVLTSSQTIFECVGGSVTVGIHTYIASGTYTDTLSTSGGCDSVVTTNFTVSPAITGSQNVTVCAGGSITVGGATHSISGTYMDILTAYNTCDSTVTTVLTVSPAIVSTSSTTVCAGDSITVNGHDYYISGSYNDTYTAANGCDSVHTTVLTVSNAIIGTLTTSICFGTSMYIGSSTYSSSGTYTDLLTAANGCDSTLTTILTVDTLVTSSQTFNMCSGGSVTVGFNTYITTGVYTDTLGTTAGCDSIVTTNLNINPFISTAQSPLVCAGGSVMVGLNTYSVDGVYTDTLTAFAGCDSIITTTLTVNPVIIADAGLPQTTCAGDTVHFGGTASGGSSALSYSWSNGALTDSIMAQDSTTTTYTFTASDITGCSASSNVMLNVIPLSDISGTVSYSGGIVGGGQAILYRYKNFYTRYDTVAFSSLDGFGQYHFSSIANGNYLVEVFADHTITALQGCMPTYYGTSWNLTPVAVWDSASFVSHSCASATTMDIDMKEKNLAFGTNHLSGRVTMDSTFRNQGEPIPGLDVKLGHNPGGQGAIISNTTTSPTVAVDGGGFYYFDSIPDGTYTIYVDIPGLVRDSTHTITVVNQTITGLDYRANDTAVYISPDMPVAIVENIFGNGFAVYPNPFSQSATIEYDLKTDADVRLDVFDVMGKKIKTLADGKQNEGKHSYMLNADGDEMSAGVYFVRLVIGGKVTTERVVVN